MKKIKLLDKMESEFEYRYATFLQINAFDKGFGWGNQKSI